MYQRVDQSLLGTVVRISVSTKRFRSSPRTAKRMLGEARRLEKVFNRFDPESELSGYRRSGSTSSAELRQVIDLANGWVERTDGLFDPTKGTGEIESIDLNAIAKGWIVDRTAEVARGVHRVVIDAGGDLLHSGEGEVRVGVENPAIPFDNAAPIGVVKFSNGAVATSGPARRGDHLIDPRTGNPPVDILSASVFAGDAATADVMATALAITTVGHALEIAEREGVAALLVDRAGSVSMNERWRALVSEWPGSSG